MKPADNKVFEAAMNRIVAELKAAGYNPYDQLRGYLQTGNAVYITRQGNARTLIQGLDKEQIAAYVSRMVYRKAEDGGSAMRIKIIECEFSVCKVPDYSQVNFSQEYCFIGKTDEENSLVCPSSGVPENAAERDDGWKAFRIEGTLDFSLIGILSKISSLLAANAIGIFAISTYNTDYILTKAENFSRAIAVLTENGYVLA